METLYRAFSYHLACEQEAMFVEVGVDRRAPGSVLSSVVGDSSGRRARHHRRTTTDYDVIETLQRPVAAYLSAATDTESAVAKDDTVLSVASSVPSKVHSPSYSIH